MQKMKPVFVAIGLLLLLFVAATAFLRKAYDKSGTEFIVSENKKQFSIQANFQMDKSHKVHSYLRRELNLTDIPNLTRVDIRDYHTADGSMTLSIKSRKRALRIVIDKRVNSEEAYLKMKKLAAGLEKVLTR